MPRIRPPDIISRLRRRRPATAEAFGKGPMAIMSISISVGPGLAMAASNAASKSFVLRIRNAAGRCFFAWSSKSGVSSGNRPGDWHMRVLDVGDDAIGLIVHQHEDDFH